ncbi:MAG: hypothetical protein JWQ90_1775 [Hydrocarboniphaga sp.]|uniref:hypothetical protein n=1 Tax=Hydrocarboniphaga sp. TaxID=2033016 RepID=UPI002601F741|nr:hypothetical protein [Hydrocarboniphaga sp.]MDB5969325.1 hypothetical protein [Hydrocarboniphaga sp.]
MNAHELSGTTEANWMVGFKQPLLGMWRKIKKVLKSIERSMDSYDESCVRGW